MTTNEKDNSAPLLAELTDRQAEELCARLRQELIDDVSRTGGHLASNLGAVELTVAIHRVFNTARDRLVFDVGHQCYVHKILTGRREEMAHLRQFGGIAGFPKPGESIHDAFVAGHASNSVAVALGMARARTQLGEDYKVLALIGDGALTGGLAYEGLSNAGQCGQQLLVILNNREEGVYLDLPVWEIGVCEDDCMENVLTSWEDGFSTREESWETENGWLHIYVPAENGMVLRAVR